MSQVTNTEVFPQVCVMMLGFGHLLPQGTEGTFKTWLTFGLSVDPKSSQGEKLFL